MQSHWSAPLPSLRAWLAASALACLAASALALSPGRFQFTQPSYSTTQDFGVAYITVQRSLGVDGRAAVYVSTALAGGGNAVPGRDFKPVFNRSLVWQDGDDLEKELYVQILNDGLPQEVPKTFTLYLHDANGAPINPDRNTTRVVLEPPSNLRPGSFRFLNATLDANEVIVAVDHPATSALAIPVVWENGTTSSAQVQFEVVCESACSPSDFSVISPADAVLKWTRGGPRVQNILLSIPDDNVYEQMESFRVRLQLIEALADGSAVVGGAGVIGSIGEVLVRIAGPNDVQTGSVQFQAECFPACASAKYTVFDGGAAQVVLQRRNGSDGAASVTLRTIDGTARANVDYKPLTRVVQWGDGDARDKTVVVEALADVSRLETKRFALELVGNTGAALSDRHASKSYVDIIGPSNIVLGDVNFAAAEPLERVLRHPDESFLTLTTRLNSRLSMCPRMVVTAPGVVELLLQRNFANIVGPASVTLRTVDATAIAGVDYAPLAPAATVVTWQSGDASRKRVQLTILDPKQFYTDTRTFAIEIASISNVGLGACHRVDVLLQSVGEAPRIAAFDLDMNARQLALTLSHTMLAATLDASKLTLQSERVVRPGSATSALLQLSRQTTTASGDGTQIVLDISTNEMHALKMLRVLATSAATVFLSAQRGLFRYVVESCESPLSSECAVRELAGTTAPLAVTTFVADTVSPVLVSFSLDLAQQLLKLRFSEPVDRTRVRVDALGLSESANGAVAYQLSSATRVFSPTPDPLSGALLQDANKLPPDGTYLVLQLSAADADALRALGTGQVGLQRTTTFLSLTRDFVSDFAVPPNAVAPINGALLQAAAGDCSACPAGTYLAASCSDTKDRVCAACTVCPTNAYALTACTAVRDTVCYPCTECRGSQYAAVQCTPSTDRVCESCTKCTRDEYEASPCANGVNRVCRTCDSCTLTKEQQRTCEVSFKWRRKLMKAPYACPLTSQKYQTREARLQRAKSNRCGAGRCSCSNSGVGNFNPNADSFPDDIRCTEPAVYNIFL